MNETVNENSRLIYGLNSPYVNNLSSEFLIYRNMQKFKVLLRDLLFLNDVHLSFYS